jgi:Tfp pilus assembly protein PilF
MFGRLRLAVVFLTLGVSHASAQLETLVQGCSDPDASPRDVINFCQRALATGKLSEIAQAQVRSNMGTGYFELQSYSDAAAEYTRAIQLDPGLTAAYMNRARAHERLGRLPEANADYAKVLELDPLAADAHLGRGAMLLANGDPARSVQDFNRAIEMQPQWISPYFNRGVAHYQLGLWDLAERDFSVVIERSPEDAAAYLNRARSRAAMDNVNAGADYDKALEIDPEWGGAWFARGQYWDSRGNREAANQDFIRAYELGYPDAWLLERIREISG